MTLTFQALHQALTAPPANDDLFTSEHTNTRAAAPAAHTGDAKTPFADVRSARALDTHTSRTDRLPSTSAMMPLAHYHSCSI